MRMAFRVTGRADSHAHYLEVLFRLDPHVEISDAEMFSFSFEAGVQVVVEALGVIVEEREDAWTSHKAEKMIEQDWVGIDEVRAIFLGYPGALV